MVNPKFFIYNKLIIESIVWLILLALLTIVNTSVDIRISLLSSFSILVSMMFVTYVNRYVLIPWILERRVFLLYILCAVALIIVVGFFCYEVEKVAIVSLESYLFADPDISLLDIQLPSENKSFFDHGTSEFESGVFVSEQVKIYFILVCKYLVDFIVYYYYKTEKEDLIKQDLTRQKTEMELKFLRSQINPHFLFNALNNIYSMVYMNDKNAPDCILALSEMLRYVTDESAQDKIVLKDEINYIENYINFQKYSFENEINLTFEKDIESEYVYISPMLLEPFVENGFKYSGIGMNKDSFLEIIIRTKGNKLFFKTRNSKFIKEKKGRTERNGVGLQNVMKRITLLYPDTHTLDISEDNDVFCVELTLDLKQEKR